MSRFTQAVVAGLLTGGMGLFVTLLPFGLQLEEDVGLAFLFKMRGTRRPPPDVIVVSLDKTSSEKLNIPADPDKWPRHLHARMTENLAKGGASVIVFDMHFAEPRSENEDLPFATAIENAGNVVLGELLKRETLPVATKKGTSSVGMYIEKLVPPIDPLARSAMALAPFPLPKVPVRVSQYWTFKSSAGDKPTMPVVAFQIHTIKFYEQFVRLLKTALPSFHGDLPADRDEVMQQKSVERLTRVVKEIFHKNPEVGRKMLSMLEIPESQPRTVEDIRVLSSLIKLYSSPDSRYLNFYGPPGTIPTVPYYRVVQDGEDSTLNQKRMDFHGKAVFVGLSERLRPEQKDGFYTVFSQPTGLDISGVEILATAFANLAEDLPIQPLSNGSHIALLMFWGLILGLICRLFPASISAACVIGMGAVYLIGAEKVFAKTGLWCPVVFPMLFQAPLAYFGIISWKYFETNKERKNIRKAFGYYLPDEVVDHLADDIADLKRSDQVIYGICMFTDAARYTTVSETMAPKKLGDFMEKYFEAIFWPVKKYGGLIVDLKGDSMLAIWKAAQPEPSMSRQACLAALEISHAVHQFNEFYKDLKLPTRIGLHSGELLLGTVGAVGHYEYRPTGDTVNTASRLEGLNKFLGTEILVSEEVATSVDEFLTRKVGKFLVAGKSKPVVVHELICRLEECSQAQRLLCDRFAEGLKACQMQRWDKAEAFFQKAIHLYGKDGPCEFYLSKCEEFKHRLPESDWDGIVELDQK